MKSQDRLTESTDSDSDSELRADSDAQCSELTAHRLRHCHLSSVISSLISHLSVILFLRLLRFMNQHVDTFPLPNLYRRLSSKLILLCFVFDAAICHLPWRVARQDNINSLLSAAATLIFCQIPREEAPSTYLSCRKRHRPPRRRRHPCSPPHPRPHCPCRRRAPAARLAHTA